MNAAAPPQPTRRFRALYTKHVRQKNKVYHDGFVLLRASSVLLALTDEAFTHPQIELVTICADLSNERSRATAERAGFRWVTTRPTPSGMRSLIGTDVEAVYELRRHTFDPTWRKHFSQQDSMGVEGNELRPLEG